MTDQQLPAYRPSSTAYNDGTVRLRRGVLMDAGCPVCGNMASSHTGAAFLDCIAAMTVAVDEARNPEHGLPTCDVEGCMRPKEAGAAYCDLTWGQHEAMFREGRLQTCGYCGDKGAEWQAHRGQPRYCSDFHAAMAEARDREAARIEAAIQLLHDEGTEDGLAPFPTRWQSALLEAIRTRPEDRLPPCKVEGLEEWQLPTPEVVAEMRSNHTYKTCSAETHLPGCPEGPSA